MRIQIRDDTLVEQAESALTCGCCTDEYEAGCNTKPDMLNPNELVRCGSCDRPVCDLHVRESGECRDCSGPTDAELNAAGMVSR